MKTIQFGVHYMLDCYGADATALANKENLTTLLRTIPDKLAMHTISEAQVVEVGPLNEKDSGGVSGFVMIAESHISFHTFPGRQFVSIDVYTCQDTIDSDTLTKLFTEHFKCTDYEETVIPRGTRYPAEEV